MRSSLVTGGAGFIGSNFVRAVVSATDLSVVVVDRLTYAGSLLNLADVPAGRITFVRGDIADGVAMADVFRRHRPRWVVNFAAESHVDRSIDGPRAFIQTNIVGTFELLEASCAYLRAARGSDPASFRFLHVSTDEVYGTLGPDGGFTEETPYAPNSPYAASKAAADHLVRAYTATYGVPALVTNCSNNYGPFQYPEKLIPLTILNAIEGRPLPIYGDGLNVRDWLHVSDHCAAILLVLERGRPGEKYNIGGSDERTNVAVIDSICSALDALLPARTNPALAARGVSRYSELKSFVPDRPGHDRRYAIDARKIHRELGWTPRQQFDRGVETTVRWYLDHRDWCRTVQGASARPRLGLAVAPTTPAAL